MRELVSIINGWRKIDAHSKAIMNGKSGDAKVSTSSTSELSEEERLKRQFAQAGIPIQVGEAPVNNRIVG